LKRNFHFLITNNENFALLIYSHRCCSRLRSFAEEKTLWIHADFKRKPLQAQQILKRLKFLTPDTKSLSLRGMYSYYPLDKYKNITITQNMLNNIRDYCPQLENLEILEGFIDIEKVSEVAPTGKF
jgi:hypothetical protein